jgi:hypothetical protein
MNLFKDIIEFENKKYLVSTVKLPIDHGFDGTPLWFETMIFAMSDSGVDYDDLYCDRYQTEEQAEVGHKHTVLSWKETGKVSKL